MRSLRRLHKGDSPSRRRISADANGRACQACAPPGRVVASQCGRYGCRRVAALLLAEALEINRECVKWPRRRKDLKTVLCSRGG
jgi:hypothetical protein